MNEWPLESLDPKPLYEAAERVVAALPQASGGLLSRSFEVEVGRVSAGPAAAAVPPGTDDAALLVLEINLLDGKGARPGAVVLPADAAAALVGRPSLSQVTEQMERMEHLEALTEVAASLLDGLNLTLFPGSDGVPSLELAGGTVERGGAALSTLSPTLHEAECALVSFSLVTEEQRWPALLLLSVPFLRVLSPRLPPKRRPPAVAETTEEPAGGRFSPGASREEAAEMPHSAAPEGVPVRPVELQQLRERGNGQAGRGVDLLLDVTLTVRVELGQRQMKVQEILAIAPGTVIELDRLAGEPADVVINDRLIARGEIVVVDENFGVRITEIVTPRARAEAQA